MLCPTEALLTGNQFKRLYEKKIREMATRCALTSAEINVLLFLANNPDYNTAKEISRMRMLPKSCVSKAVDSLIRKGFLASQEDEKDHRILHLFILPAANTIVEDARSAQEAFFSLIFQNFSQEERDMLDALTKKLIANMKETITQC